MAVGVSNLGLISRGIYLFGILSIGSSLQCFKCGEKAKGAGDCTTNMCTGKCGVISYSSSLNGGTVNTLKLRMCLPDGFSNEKVCAAKKPVSVSSACGEDEPDCTCKVTRCSTDRCNGNFAVEEYKIITKDPMAIVDEDGKSDDPQIPRDSQASKSGSSATHASLTLIGIAVIFR